MRTVIIGGSALLSSCCGWCCAPPLLLGWLWLVFVLPRKIEPNTEKSKPNANSNAGWSQMLEIVGKKARQWHWCLPDASVKRTLERQPINQRQIFSTQLLNTIVNSEPAAHARGARLTCSMCCWIISQSSRLFWNQLILRFPAFTHKMSASTRFRLVVRRVIHHGLVMLRRNCWSGPDRNHSDFSFWWLISTNDRHFWHNCMKAVVKKSAFHWHCLEVCQLILKSSWLGTLCYINTIYCSSTLFVFRNRVESINQLWVLTTTNFVS